MLLTLKKKNIKLNKKFNSQLQTTITIALNDALSPHCVYTINACNDDDDDARSLLSVVTHNALSISQSHFLYTHL